MVSEYEYRRISRKCDFKSYLFHELPNLKKFDAYSDAFRHVLPQHQFIMDANGKRLVDFIGRFERLESDFAVICSHLNIASESNKLPHFNKSRRRGHYSEYYDSESSNFVAYLYRKDIELFGYEY